MVFHGAINPIYMNLTGLKIIDTCEAFDQRGFAGSVFSHQRVYLALAKGKINTIQSLNPGESH